jgi:hypothetical protein
VKISPSNNAKIYIVCPANYATGGPEALHQLGAALISLGLKAFMYYVHYKVDENASPIHEKYRKYQVPFVFVPENHSTNLIIFPETFISYVWNQELNNLQKAVWWLSVTNFFISHQQILDHYKQRNKLFFIKRLYKKYPIPSLRAIKKLQLTHIAHSYFSVDFLRKNNIATIGQISDYMNDIFLTGSNYAAYKEDIIIYNPVKNGKFLEEMIQIAPELNWIPIKNMSNEEVFSIMKKAKVYVDFGYHPGKERMPREACLMDCCLIIGKEGSAKYKEDMPIKDDYHFDKDQRNYQSIINKIKNCLQNYDSRVIEFSEYKASLLKEQEQFLKDVKKVFIQQYE